MINEIKNMSLEELFSEEVVSEVFSIEDEIKRTVKINELRERAREFRRLNDMTRILKAHEKALETAKAEARIAASKQTVDGLTSFSGLETQLRCGEWLAGENGIVRQSRNPFYPDRLACYHPIVPKQRMQNIQTGEQQIELAYKYPNERTWNTVRVPKSIIASQQKIVALSDYGIGVTSENAKLLVAYLSDIEYLNRDCVPLSYSSSKLGWVKHGGKDCFIPYLSNGIEFDSSMRFLQLLNSISDYGSEDIWLEHVRKLRASKRPELLIMLAASFASVLVRPCGTLPFIVDLWGDTEGGKTVTLMVAASVWADPSNNAYIGDYKTTDTALEIKADVLNSFPLILDDTSTISKKMKDSMEGLIYSLCSGNGRSRSNKSLGINRENTWSCAILTCGEKPLQDYAEQGGAINRIIEIHCEDYLYKDPHETAEIVKSNYGFWGKFFVMAVSKMDFKDLQRQRDDIFAKLNTNNKMQKQSYAMSVILLADQLIEKYIFQDGITINMDDAIKAMADHESVSDNQRAYEYVIDMVNMNSARFDPVSEKPVEQWGFRSDGYINFYATALNKILQDGGYGMRPFLAWLDKKRLLEKDNDGIHMAKQMKVGGKKIRAYRIKITDENQEDSTQNDGEDFTQAKLDLGYEYD